ncbi:ABC transporter substrate-binding protein [Halothermothrix orenii]|uniref:Periplasmic binding protein/LacI transcriptional regulator n=1 Tax=Halothermothrix orenii (strain H 168 / OCM 544 / DSM 9562) TaxID=373903 RepID=B8CWP1_HALOH|nr:ABC transporter substrate-binding protein [Halothermothrix orenii]ACL69710.1 periplasmic binding protein/LacI transcriptional regulator [Halothermothrix orenii H 168]
MTRKALFVALVVLLLTVGFLSVGDVQASEKYQILVSPKGLSQSYWLTVKAGAEAAAKELGAEIVWRGPAQETDVAKQVNVINDFVNKKIDAIVVAATDANALIPPLKRAHEAGIPVITIDSGINADFPISHIATNNKEAAKKAAEVLANIIGKKGEVACIPFVAGAATSIARENGFKEGISNYKNIDLVAVQYSQSDYATAMKVTENILTAHPNLKGIFAANEAGAVGAARALKARGKTADVILVGFDAAQTEIDAMKEGIIDALIVQRPYMMGYEGVKNAVAALEGEEVEKLIDTGVVVATPDNMNDPEVYKVLFPLKQ